MINFFTTLYHIYILMLLKQPNGFCNFNENHQLQLNRIASQCQIWLKEMPF